jgi:hypothetical protein
MSIPRAFELYYFKVVLNWRHSPFKLQGHNALSIKKINGFFPRFFDLKKLSITFQGRIQIRNWC